MGLSRKISKEINKNYKEQSLVIIETIKSAVHKLNTTSEDLVLLQEVGKLQISLLEKPDAELSEEELNKIKTLWRTIANKLVEQLNGEISHKRRNMYSSIVRAIETLEWSEYVPKLGKYITPILGGGAAAPKREESKDKGIAESKASATESPSATTTVLEEEDKEEDEKVEINKKIKILSNIELLRLKKEFTKAKRELGRTPEKALRSVADAKRAMLSKASTAASSSSHFVISQATASYFKTEVKKAILHAQACVMTSPSEAASPEATSPKINATAHIQNRAPLLQEVIENTFLEKETVHSGLYTGIQQVATLLREYKLETSELDSTLTRAAKTTSNFLSSAMATTVSFGGTAIIAGLDKLGQSFSTKDTATEKDRSTEEIIAEESSAIKVKQVLDKTIRDRSFAMFFEFASSLQIMLEMEQETAALTGESLLTDTYAKIKGVETETTTAGISGLRRKKSGQQSSGKRELLADITHILGFTDPSQLTNIDEAALQKAYRAYTTFAGKRSNDPFLQMEGLIYLEYEKYSRKALDGDTKLRNQKYLSMIGQLTRALEYFDSLNKKSAVLKLSEQIMGASVSIPYMPKELTQKIVENFANSSIERFVDSSIGEACSTAIACMQGEALEVGLRFKAQVGDAYIVTLGNIKKMQTQKSALQHRIAVNAENKVKLHNKLVPLSQELIALKAKQDKDEALTGEELRSLPRLEKRTKNIHLNIARLDKETEELETQITAIQEDITVLNTELQEQLEEEIKANRAKINNIITSARTDIFDTLTIDSSSILSASLVNIIKEIKATQSAITALTKAASEIPEDEEVSDSLIEMIRLSVIELKQKEIEYSQVLTQELLQDLKNATDYSASLPLSHSIKGVQHYLHSISRSKAVFIDNLTTSLDAIEGLNMPIIKRVLIENLRHAEGTKEDFINKINLLEEAITNYEDGLTQYIEKNLPTKLKGTIYSKLLQERDALDAKMKEKLTAEHALKGIKTSLAEYIEERLTQRLTDAGYDEYSAMLKAMEAHQTSVLAHAYLSSNKILTAEIKEKLKAEEPYITIVKNLNCAEIQAQLKTQFTDPSILQAKTDEQELNLAARIKGEEQRQLKRTEIQHKAAKSIATIYKQKRARTEKHRKQQQTARVIQAWQKRNLTVTNKETNPTLTAREAKLSPTHPTQKTIMLSSHKTFYARFKELLRTALTAITNLIQSVRNSLTIRREPSATKQLSLMPKAKPNTDAKANSEIAATSFADAKLDRLAATKPTLADKPILIEQKHSGIKDKQGKKPGKKAGG